MTAVAQRGSTLAVNDRQDYWTDNQLAALHQLGVATNSPGDLAVFFHQAQKSGLDPFKREIYMITRSGKPTIQTGIDGFYKIADRVTTRTRGTWGISETYWCGQDGQWVDVWLQQNPPAAAKVIVERNGSKFTTVALTGEYSATGPMWKKMPARMIAKCAEALAIRKAFPEDLSGLYTSDEMAQADAPAPQQQARRPQAPTVQSSEPVDWYARLDECASLDDVKRVVSALIPAHGGKDQVPEDLQATINALWSAMKDAEADVVQAEVVNEATGEIINNEEN